MPNKIYPWAIKPKRNIGALWGEPSRQQ